MGLLLRQAEECSHDKRGQFGYGDVWTWVAIDADTKLVPSYYIGTRDGEDAETFMRDLVSRLRHRVQLTTDGHISYLLAVRGAFSGDVDYAQLMKLYGPDPKDSGGIRQPSAQGLTFARSAAIPTRSTFRPATSSGKT
jgi:hypothetical protein